MSCVRLYNADQSLSGSPITAIRTIKSVAASKLCSAININLGHQKLCLSNHRTIRSIVGWAKIKCIPYSGQRPNG